jgi:hypothetical protein
VSAAVATHVAAVPLIAILYVVAFPVIAAVTTITLPRLVTAARTRF